MHAIVIGGGIAGPLVAAGLRTQGWSATIYEARPADAASGAGAWLTVAVNGLDAMASLDMHRPVLACGFPSRTIELCSGTGKLLAAVPIGGELRDGTVTHTMRRADLVATLEREAIARGVDYRHGQRLLDVVPHPRGVEAIFADGSRARGDLLVGADGVHSQVRRLVDPGAPQPRYAGLTNIGGFTSGARVQLEPGSCRMVFGRRAFFGWAVAPSGEIWWFANVPRRRALERDELAATSSATWKQRLVEMFRDDVGPMVELVMAADEPLVVTNQHELPRVPTWRCGAMIVLGDAAHAASPSSGQGASMAAEDAVELARCIGEAGELAAAREGSELEAASEAGELAAARKGGELAAAHERGGLEAVLARYEAVRRPRVERVVAYGASMNARKTAGPIGRVLRDLFLPMVLRRIARGIGEGSLAWLYDHHVDLIPRDTDDLSPAATSRAAADAALT